MTYLPLLLSLASFGSHRSPRIPDRRGGPPGKVGTIPGAYTSPTWRPGDTTRCVCPACDPDDEPGGDDLDGGYPARGENVYRAPVAKGQRRITRAQRKVLNQAKQRRVCGVGERGKS